MSQQILKMTENYARLDLYMNDASIGACTAFTAAYDKY